MRDVGQARNVVEGQRLRRSAGSRSSAAAPRSWRRRSAMVPFSRLPPTMRMRSMGSAPLLHGKRPNAKHPRLWPGLAHDRGRNKNALFARLLGLGRASAGPSAVLRRLRFGGSAAARRFSRAERAPGGRFGGRRGFWFTARAARASAGAASAGRWPRNGDSPRESCAATPAPHAKPRTDRTPARSWRA